MILQTNNSTNCPAKKKEQAILSNIYRKYTSNQFEICYSHNHHLKLSTLTQILSFISPKIAPENLQNCAHPTLTMTNYRDWKQTIHRNMRRQETRQGINEVYSEQQHDITHPHRIELD